MFRKHGKTAILEELTKTCGASGRFHDLDTKMTTHVLLNKVQKIILTTSENEKRLYVSTYLELRCQMDNLYKGGGETSVWIEDALREPSNGETYEINCECKGGRFDNELKCKGQVWSN